MSPTNRTQRIAALRERLRHVKEGGWPGAAACREIYELPAPALSGDELALLADSPQPGVEDEIGVIAPAGLNTRLTMPEKWFRAVDAEVRARLECDHSGGEGNTENPAPILANE